MTVKNSNRKDYFRPGLMVSSSCTALGRAVRGASSPSFAAAAACALLAATATAQYPGRVTKPDTPAPTLRAVGVLEWVGEPGKPSASRLVPVSVYDGQQLNDGAIYLNRPEPLALAGGTEYELQSDGKAVRLFDVFSAGELHDAWVGFGAVKALPAAEAVKAANAFNTSSLLNGGESADDDKPVLKRKHPKGTDTDDAGAGKGSSGGSSSGSSSGGSSGASSGSGDSPTLKRKGDGGSAAGTSTDPDQPTLKRKSGDDSGSGGQTAKGDVDPDRPTIRRARKSSEAGMLETSNLAPDPDRPRLKHGKPAGLDTSESPRLDGMPANLQQAVAVSDAANRAEHPWKYTWANPDDELKMKAALEAIARTALGLDTPAAPPSAAAKSTPAAAKAGARKKTSMLHAEPAAEAAELTDEQFRVFELTYGATATLVLTAASPRPADAASDDARTTPQADETPVIKRGKPTSAPSASATSKAGSKAAKPAAKPAPQKFVTLIAQPDLYGGILVLYKSTTDAAHLDETPRMRLIDAVDAMGDNRGELLFELRGAGQRQFALYRVLRGSAEQLFATVAQP